MSSSETDPLIGTSDAGARAVGLRRVAYAASIVGCLLSASFTVFSLYTESFEAYLNYTPLQINYISIAGELGLYLCVPFIGWSADVYRLSYIGVLSCITYVIGYGGCAWVAKTGQSWGWMALFFSIIGVACSASFISSLVSSARLFSKSALLAISIPTTSYGISSLMYAKVIGLYLQPSKVHDNAAASFAPRLSSLFQILAVALFFVGVLVTLAPIWGDVDKNQSEPAHELADGGAEVTESYIKRFFSDKRTLIFLGSFVLVSGPLEAYQNNLGLLVKSSKQVYNTASQVALFSTGSTVSRLATGALTDVLVLKPSTLLITVVALLATADLAYSLGWISLSVTSVISGWVYGSSFTLFPLIISQVWGIEVFATFWGMFILGPAIGSFIFGVIFASTNGDGYSSTFALCSVLTGLGAAVIAWLRLY